MNPLNEQGEPVMQSYNSDPNNFQLNMILVRPKNWGYNYPFNGAYSMLHTSRDFAWPLKRTQSADESCDEHGDGEQLESTVR